ncbi:MAG: LysM peptidoglycan-binding domain-containing protein, partial [Victivallaceae bacterium]
MSKKMEMWQKLLIAQSGLLLVIGAAGCQPTVIYDTRTVEDIPSISQTAEPNSEIVDSEETVVIPGNNGSEIETIEDTDIITDLEISPVPAGKTVTSTPDKTTPAVKVAKSYPAFSMDAPSAMTYTVAKNDSLWKIAIKYGLTPEELADYNKLSGSKRLHVGQKLMIPPGGKMLSAAEVQKEIARQRGSVRKHASSNKSSGSSGRKVASSVKSSTTRSAATASRPADGFHIVQAGDFPAKIAKKYGI